MNVEGQTTIRGLATGIGSLPHKDARLAVPFILKYLPHIPFWPQLPRMDIREGMVAQFSENVPCVKLTADGLFVDSRDKEQDLERFYEKVISGDYQYFRISRDYAQGLYEFYDVLDTIDRSQIRFLKCHLTGPFTFAASITNEQGVALVHDEILMQAVVKALAMKALWQINLFRRFQKKIILFIDEPYLSCFGSAFTPLNREFVLRVLEELTEPLAAGDVVIGVHCCGNTDWSLFCDVDAITLISFDSFGFQDKLALYAGPLKEFFARDGILCWGMVPTQEFDPRISREALIQRLEDGISLLAAKGIDRALLSERLLISPSCGLGSLEEAAAERIAALLAQISAQLRKG